MTALYAALLMVGHQTPALKSTEIISKVLAKYAAANSGVGEVTMTQSVGSKKIAVKTDLQFERPSKLFLHQSSEAVAPNDWLVVSDGVNFGYDVPGSNGGPRRRLFEKVTTDAKVLKVHSIYLAAKRSLGDILNPFVEFATQSEGDNGSLKGFLVRLDKIKPEPQEKNFEGSDVYSITGIIGFGNQVLDSEGKPTKNFESAGRFELYVTKDFDLAGMRTVESISITDAASNLPTQLNVITTWAGKIKLNESPAAGIFTVK